MPVEVIDLLSSPEVPPPTRAPVPPKTKPSIASRPNKPSRPPSRALDYDLLDLADISNNGLLSALPPARPAPVTAAATKRPSPKAYSRAVDLSLLSDDFDTNFDLLEDDRRAKKPRIESSSRVGDTSGPLQRTKSGHGKSANGPGPGMLQPAPLRKWNPSCDPIMTSSDPFASSPRQVGKDKAKNNVIDLSLADDDDPFASSPRSVKDKGKESVNSRPQIPSSPVFVSSQPQKRDSPSPVQKKAVKGKGKAVEWDHISSSAPELGLLDDWGLGSDVQPPRKGLGRSRSDGVDFDLGDLPSGSDEDDLPDIDDIRPSRPYGKSANKVTKRSIASKASSSRKSAGEKELERLEKTAARDAEKRRKQREKDEAKEQRQRERARATALAEVNKVRTDKKVSTPEMIVDLPSSLNPSVKLQVETLLEDLNVKSHSYSSPVKNVVKWRRKVRARFSEKEAQWEPIPERVEDEKHAMVIITAPEFVELALGAQGSDLEAHVLSMQRYHDGHTLMYLIEGLTPWLRKNRNVRNRQFQSAVRNAGADAETSTSAAPPPNTQQRKKAPKPPPQYIDEDTVEDALLQLQVLHGVLVHHTAAPIETAQWVAIFTQHISTIPYRRQRDAVNSSAAFCMETGQVRTGDGPQDTYVRMLQEIARVTAPIAWGIAGEFGTVSELVRGLEREGPLALEGIRKSANRDGAYTDRNVGQAISKRLYKVFTSRDEASMEI